MWSGQSSVRLGKPQRHADALIRQIRRTYPALRGVKAEHAWIGVAGHTVHGMPQIGEVTPGLWLLERLRRPWAQHHGDGRRDGRARHRRGRPDLGDVLAVRPGLGRRRVRPRRAAGVRLVAPRARQMGWHARARVRGRKRRRAEAPEARGRGAAARSRTCRRRSSRWPNRPCSPLRSSLRPPPPSRNRLRNARGSQSERRSACRSPADVPGSAEEAAAWPETERNGRRRSEARRAASSEREQRARADRRGAA